MKRNINCYLEEKMLRYKDLLRVKVVDNGEKFIVLRGEKILSGYLPEMSDMEKIMGKKILVRESIYERLLGAQEYLKKENSDLFLYITYGYRTIEIQTQRFKKRLKEIDFYFEDSTDLYEEVHRYVAVPSVAGHPTGGAVDITILNIRSGSFIDFGTNLYDYRTKDCYLMSPNISKTALYNRLLIRKCMLKAGFAPYDGEWWHFSYGDKEWALYYKKSNAIYEQKQYNKIKKYV